MKPEQLILALEAEAGSIYLQSDLSETGNVFRDGTQYMVVDLGGMFHFYQVLNNYTVLH